MCCGERSVREGLVGDTPKSEGKEMGMDGSGLLVKGVARGIRINKRRIET